MIINKYLQMFSEEYESLGTIDKLLEFTEKTFPRDGTDKIFIGCVVIMFLMGFKGAAATREYLLSIVKAGKEKIGKTNLLSFYVKRINTNKIVSKYLKNIDEDLDFQKHLDLVIEYLEGFAFDFGATIKKAYGEKIEKYK